jgi:hypothetical protein
MRKSSIFLVYTLSLLLLLGLVLIQSSLGKKTRAEVLQARIELVSRHGLTDLCLFTEARYTRHPTQADFHSPFQDSPLTFEHFPSGSLMSPPPSLRKSHAGLD